MFDEYTFCVDLDEDWWVKIVNNYGITDYINIKNNLRDVDSIEHVEDIFTHLILPSQKIDQYGNLIEWSILDYENLYTINELPEEYFNRYNDPACCFETESESESSNYFIRNLNQVTNYFDTTIMDF